MHSGIDTAVLLVGGEGTRLRPLTYEIAKPLIPVQGKPVMEHLLDLFKVFGINSVILSVGYKKEQIKSRYGSYFNGLSISYVEEDQPLGTAGPLKLLEEQGRLPSKPFIVSNGDELKDIDINEMSSLHMQNNALVTIALTKVQDPSVYGVARLEGNKILEFVEKPAPGTEPSNFINSGFYIYTPEAVALAPKGRSMSELSVFPKVASMGRLYGYKC